MLVGGNNGVITCCCMMHHVIDHIKRTGQACQTGFTGQSGSRRLRSPGDCMIAARRSRVVMLRGVLPRFRLSQAYKCLIR